MKYAAAVLAVVLAGAHGNNPTGGTAPPAIRATVNAARPFFGDAFEYVVIARVQASPSVAVTVVAPVGPFAELAAARTTRTQSSGGLATVEVTRTIACLSIACVPTATGKRVVLPPARVVVDGVSTPAARVVVVLRPRVSANAVAANEARFERPTSLPAPTTRLSASLLTAVLALAGVALVVVGLTVALVRTVTSRRAPGRQIDPIARAVRLLRESATRPAPDRRRAASLASRIVGEEPLRRDAERVAWSPPAPAPSEAEGLADRVEHTAEVSS